MDEATWAALTATLTILGGVWTVHAFRSRGVASGLRGLGLTLIPPAAYLTGTLEMFTEIGGSVLDWGTHLVLSPLVWVGILLAGMAVVCLGASGALRERGRGVRARDDADAPALPSRAESRARPTKSDDGLDDEIEAILRKRGIT